MLGKNISKKLVLIFLAVIIVAAVAWLSISREKTQAVIADQYTTAPVAVVEEGADVEQAVVDGDIETEAAVEETVVEADGTAADVVVDEEVVVDPVTGEGEAAVEATVTEEDKGASLLSTPAALTIDVAAAMEDRVLGDVNAPVTIIEYASMTCPHCAHFATKVLPEVKKQLVETGKAKIIFRDFPLDSYAVKAAMMARCAPADKYFGLVEVIFTNQERWTQAADPLGALAQLGVLAGMDMDTINACVSNVELENALLARLNEAQGKYNIRSTPTFVFNDGAEILAGGQDANAFTAIVNKLTNGN